MLLCLLNSTINKAGPTGHSFVTPRLLFCRVIRCHKERLRKIAIVSEQGSTAGPWCIQRGNINDMHVNLSWLKVEERLTLSLIVLVRGDMLNAPSCLFELLAHSSGTHAYPTRHATRGLFRVPKSKTDYMRCRVLHRAMTTWNSIPHQVTHASSKMWRKKQIKIHLLEQRGLWSNTNIGTCIQTHNNIRTIHTHTHGFCVVDMC